MKQLIIAVLVFLTASCGMTPNKATVATTKLIRELNQQVIIAYDSGWISAVEARDAVLKLKEANDQLHGIEATLDICETGPVEGLDCDLSGEREDIDRILAEIQRKLQEAER